MIPEDEHPLDLSFDETLLHIATARLAPEPLTPVHDPEDGLQGEHVYQRIALLGAGAMGEVHLVNDPLLQRQIAYKQLRAQTSASAPIRARFLNEVKITAQLEHPYIVPIYCLEMTPEGPAYTMKRVMGKTLKDVLAPLKQRENYTPTTEANSLPERLTCFLKVCDAMAYAHTKGILHRDLKPANIMLGDWGEVYLMDWGIARPFGKHAKDYAFEAEEKGQCLGTPRYMSPEQARGANDRLDQRSDVFTLGLILFELVTLRTPYRAETLAELLAKVRQGQREPLRGLHGQPIPRPLQRIVQRATALKRAERYASAQDLASDLRRYLNGEAVLAAPESAGEKAQRLLKRYRNPLFTGLCAVVLGSAGFSLVQLWQRQQALEMAQQQETERLALLSLVSEQGRTLDYQLMQTQHKLYTLGGHTVQTLLHGAPDLTPPPIENRDSRSVYYSKLPQVFYGRHYRTDLSLDVATYSVAYQLDAASLKPELQVLQGQRQVFAPIFRQTLSDPDSPQWRDEIGNAGTPLMFINVVTPSGILQSYPAVYYGTPGYDPRERPFYKLAAYQRGLRCGRPYLDRITGSLLPCSMAIYSPQDTFLGTVSLDMQFKYLARKFLSLPAERAKESYLLNTEGQIMVKSSDQNTRIVTQDKINTGQALSHFDNPELLAAIQKQTSMGLIDASAHHGKLAFIRLNFLGWYFVVEAL